MKTLLRTLIIVAALACTAFSQQSMQTRFGGRYWASNYNVGWNINVTQGTASGAGSIVVSSGQVTLPDGRKIVPFAVGTPITVSDGTLTENVTVTAVSGCGFGNALLYQCTLSATFSNAHGAGAGVQIVSATGGLAEAINDAHAAGGGIVAIDGSWTGTNATIATAPVYSNVSIEDLRFGGVQYWNVQQGASTFLAAPTTLTGVTALASATPVGAYGTGTYFMCISYVDVAGQEGPCSATFSQAGLATGSFIFSPPAASAGAVGYTIYISLTSGTYSLAYQVPLTTSVCTLTTVETVTPACAVANTTYGQAGATATVTAITVATSPVDMQLGGVSGTLLTGNPNGRTTYVWTSSSHIGSVMAANLAFTVGGIGSATPIAMGSVNLPAGFMNQVGKTIRVCGKFLNTDVNSSVQNVDIYWDAAGSNTAGSPVKLADLKATGTGTAAAYEGSFCENFVTTVSGAGATAGSILPGPAYFEYALVSTGNVVGNGQDTVAAAVASLNLAGTVGFSNRLSIVHTNTTGNATPQLQSLTIEVL